VTSVLSIDRVSKLYSTSSLGGGLVPSLRQVSFDISAGEVVTLIGESGSGKTTLGRIVLRLTSATSGRVTFDGQEISAFSGPRLREYYRQVQGVFQDPFSSYNPSTGPTGSSSSSGPRTSRACPDRSGRTRSRRRCTPSPSTRATCSAGTRTSSPAASSSAC
jgi:ABC-type oligopeptide transport system ATPase subunit